MPMTIIPGDLDDPRVRTLLEHHVATARAATAPGSAHALDLEDLKAPEISFWAAWDGDALLGVGALKRLSNDHGEIKSSWEYFLPARALYERHGFRECPPFGDYVADPNSIFMSLHLP